MPEAPKKTSYTNRSAMLVKAVRERFFEELNPDDHLFENCDIKKVSDADP